MSLLYYGSALLVLCACGAWALYRVLSQQVRGLRLRFDAVARSSADAICLEDAQGVVQYWSPGGFGACGPPGRRRAVAQPYR
jgi:PAS domain-containing protein